MSTQFKNLISRASKSKLVTDKLFPIVEAPQWAENTHIRVYVCFQFDHFPKLKIDF